MRDENPTCEAHRPVFGLGFLEIVVEQLRDSRLQAKVGKGCSTYATFLCANASNTLVEDHY